MSIAHHRIWCILGHTRPNVSDAVEYQTRGRAIAQPVTGMTPDRQAPPEAILLEGDVLSYQVTVLEGRIPSNAGLASLFIDIIGMPLSFAGARRRMWRRAVFR